MICVTELKAALAFENRSISLFSGTASAPALRSSDSAAFQEAMTAQVSDQPDPESSDDRIDKSGLSSLHDSPPEKATVWSRFTPTPPLKQGCSRTCIDASKMVFDQKIDAGKQSHQVPAGLEEWTLNDGEDKG